MKPLRNEIVVKQQAKKNKTDAGIILPDETIIAENVGVVLAIGKAADEVTVDDKVLFGPGYVTQVIDGKEVLFMKEENILCLL
tara:strand:+ start:805 stop:1053 length:249 start_codon:yes stop_codon:yes gene_type:complete